MRWTGYIARMGPKRNAYRILVEKPDGKTKLGRLRRKWENNIKIDFIKKTVEGVGCVHVAQGRDQWRVLVNTGNM
jgi:hypothetical protein